MPYLANSTSPEKDKITLKMPVKEKLTTEQQLQELLASKQKEEEEKKKEEQWNYKVIVYGSWVAFAVCLAISLLFKGFQIYHENIKTNNHEVGTIIKGFFSLDGVNVCFWISLVFSLLFLFCAIFFSGEKGKKRFLENKVV
jgi:hypothetical protein